MVNRKSIFLIYFVFIISGFSIYSKNLLISLEAKSKIMKKRIMPVNKEIEWINNRSNSQKIILHKEFNILDYGAVNDSTVSST